MPPNVAILRWRGRAPVLSELMLALKPLQIFLTALALTMLVGIGCGSDGTGTETGSNIRSGGGGAETLSGDTTDAERPPPGGFNNSTGGSDADGGTGSDSATGDSGSGSAGDTPNTSVELQVPTPTDSTQTVRSAVSFDGTSSADGFVQLSLHIGNTTSFQSVTFAPVLFATLSLVGPNGAILADVDDDPVKSMGTLAAPTSNVLPFPANSADPEMVRGTYVQMLTFNTHSARSFSGRLVAKKDPDLNRGTVRANIFLVGTAVQSAESRAAIEAAVEHWRTIYGVRDLALDQAYYTADSDTGVLPSPFGGSDFYLTQVSRADIRSYSVNIFIGLDISPDDSTETGDSIGLLGLAGGIPGPAVASTRSAVAVALNLIAGRDGVVAGAEIELLGETMAHESGHYLGLFHPINIDIADPAAPFTTGDPLVDTPVCSDQAQCRAVGLAENLMYPVATPGVEQTELSVEQGAVLRLQVLVD